MTVITPMLSRFLNVPFNDGTRVHLIDEFTADGVETTFGPVVNKAGFDIGSSVEAGGSSGVTVLYPRSSGELTIDGDEFTVESAPLNGYTIIVPGSTAHTPAASDQDDDLGRVYEGFFFIADPDTIHLYQYTNWPANTGIKLEYVKKLATEIAEVSWFQLAPANADGTVGTYGAAGVALETASISTQDSNQAVIAPLDTDITVSDGTNFTAGDYILINKNQSTEEIVKILSIAGDVLTTSGFSYTHAEDEIVLTCGRKIWVKMTIPLDACNGNIMNMYGVVLRVRARVTVRP